MGTVVSVGMNRDALLAAHSIGCLQAPVLATQSESLRFIGGKTNNTHVVAPEIFAPYSGAS